MPAFDMINFEQDFQNITEVYYEKFIKVGAMALALTASVGTVAPVVDQPQTVQAASKTVKSGSLTFHIKKKQVRKSQCFG